MLTRWFSLEAALFQQDASPSGQKGDFVDGGADDDTLVGDIGNDALNGGLGDDIILGGAGDDERHHELVDQAQRHHGCQGQHPHLLGLC